VNAEFFLEAINDIDDKYIEEAMCYKMKKKISIKKIVAVAACVALIVGMIPLISHFSGTPATGTTGGVITPSVIKLGENGNFTVLEKENTTMGGFITNIDAEHKTEIELLDKSFVDDAKVDDSIIFGFNGRSFAGAYVKSRLGAYYNSDVDMYRWRRTQFFINRETGKCTYFSQGLPKMESDEVLTRDECFEIVLEHFNSYGYVDDPENYTFTEDHYFGNKQMGYWFVFTRVIDGIKTCDDIKIFISSYGEIYAYHALMLGTMKNVDISSLNFAELESAVEKKLKTIYSKYPDMTYISDVVLTRLADGSFAFEYDTTVSVTNEDGAECSEYCYFVIKID
jgi:hypothetical protein